MSRRLALWLLAGLLAALAVSWFGDVSAPLGDNHEGRILARFALGIDNVEEKGLIDGALGADMSPYGNIYAHHPPIPNWSYLAAATLPIKTEAALRVVSALYGLVTIPALVFLLRGFGVRWSAAVPAVALMAVTTHFWLYGRVVGGIALPILAVAMAIRMRDASTITRPQAALLGVSLAASAAWSWIGLAVAGGTCAWLLWHRRHRLLEEGLRERVALGAAVGGLVGLGLTVTWVAGHHGVEQIIDQVVHRSGSSGGSATTLGDLVRRQQTWMPALFPNWWLVLFVPSVIAGALHRRLRWLSLLASVTAIGYVVLLRQGAVVHDYWTFPLLGAGAIGTAALLDLAIDRLPHRLVTVAASGVVVLLLAIHLPGIVGGETVDDLHAQPRQAGELVHLRAPDVEDGQAWFTPGIATPRWLSWYWDVSVKQLEDLADARASDTELVLVRLDRLPSWWVDDMQSVLLAEQGRYGIARIGDLRASARPD
ncbi:MAG: hypothetical protein R3249_06770 [Nitriliruptorales bacterium]|nr:hypothetical protein [Nitriliruptorales bacterium]